MTIDIMALDRHMHFVEREEAMLRKRTETWAQDKAESFKQLHEFLRRIRQDEQMRGMNGERIG